jgi:plastocyanin
MRVSRSVALAALTLACGGDNSGTGPPPPAPPPSTATVTTPQTSFSPNSVTIAAGGSVTWNIQGFHNVHFVNATPFPGGSARSSDPVTSGTFTGTFQTPGTYLYYCEPHGHGTTNSPSVSGMSGQVVVQ